MTYPRNFSHIGLSVPNLEQAISFYSEVMGWYIIMEPSDVVEDDSPIGVMCTDAFGAGWEKFRIAHMATGDRVGIELFEFPNNEKPENNFEFWKTGIFHYAIQDPDIEGMVEKIVAHGGKQRMVYCEDPFGNLVELYSHSYELTYSEGAY